MATLLGIPSGRCTKKPWRVLPNCVEDLARADPRLRGRNVHGDQGGTRRLLEVARDAPEEELGALLPASTMLSRSKGFVVEMPMTANYGLQADAPRVGEHHQRPEAAERLAEQCRAS